MNKKNYIALVLISIFSIVFGKISTEYKNVIPILLMLFVVIVFFYIVIWRIKQNINFKKYGPEEIIKIEDIIITEQNIAKCTKILSNNKADNCDEKTLIEKFTVKVSNKSKTQELLENLNNMLNDMEYKIYISEDEILKYDYDFIKVRRENDYSTLRHDTNIIIKILNSYNLEVVNIETKNSNIYDINMGIVSFDKLEELKELGDYDEIIEE